jgi:2-oxoglutarate dehydrogenase complex dehydrogenase (E1) component-like enzyme
MCRARCSVKLEAWGADCFVAQVRSLLADRRQMVATADSRVDWAMAEALAVGTLLLHR